MDKKTVVKYGTGFGLAYVFNIFIGGLLYIIFDLIVESFVGQERAAAMRSNFTLLATVAGLIWFLYWIQS